MTRDPEPLKQGQRFTVANHYRRRTFWQWLTRQPREFQVYEVTQDWRDTALDLGRAREVE